MKVVGIVVEYNPFHNGHLYHLQETKRLLKPDLLVAVMSPNFTQRGDIAILDKFTRAKIALTYGVDLVIELPYRYATSSADTFAFGAIRLLNAVGCQAIAFGSEKNDANALQMIAEWIDTPVFQTEIRRLLDEGYSYPKASELALHIFDSNLTPIDTNDILGIQYIRAIRRLNPAIAFHTIKRIGSHYRDEKLSSGPISSATAIRLAVKENRDISPYVPKETYQALQKQTKDWEDFYPYLKYQIITLGNRLKDIHDMTEGLDQRIRKINLEASSFYTLLNRLTSRRHTESKIRRVLLHILTMYTKEDVSNHQDYIRILGFNQTKSSLIKRILKNAPYPVITNVRKEHFDFIAFDLKSDAIYHFDDPSSIQKIPVWIERE